MKTSHIKLHFLACAALLAASPLHAASPTSTEDDAFKAECADACTAIAARRGKEKYAFVICSKDAGTMNYIAERMGQLNNYDATKTALEGDIAGLKKSKASIEADIARLNSEAEAKRKALAEKSTADDNELRAERDRLAKLLEEERARYAQAAEAARTAARPQSEPVRATPARPRLDVIILNAD